MRSISSGIVGELEGDTFAPFFLLDIMLDSEGHHFTDSDIPIYFDGYEYVNRGFKINSIDSSMRNIVDNMRLEVDNADSYFQSLFIGSVVQGTEVTLRTVLLDDDKQVIDDDYIGYFSGTLDSWNLDEERVDMTITSPMAAWSQTTLALQSASCRWKVFGGVECQYAGAETSCNRTYTRCQELSNTANFGGFRWLPSLIAKEIWWGREPEGVSMASNILSAMNPIAERLSGLS